MIIAYDKPTGIEEPIGIRVIELLKSPTIIERDGLLALRDDRLRAEGLVNLIATAEAELSRIENKYLPAQSAE